MDVSVSNKPLRSFYHLFNDLSQLSGHDLSDLSLPIDSHARLSSRSLAEPLGLVSPIRSSSLGVLPLSEDLLGIESFRGPDPTFATPNIFGHRHSDSSLHLSISSLDLEIDKVAAHNALQKSLGFAKTSFIYSPLPKNSSDLPSANFTVTMALGPPSEQEESSSGSDYGDLDAPSIDEEVVRHREKSVPR